jgi:hypothetical protein
MYVSGVPESMKLTLLLRIFKSVYQYTNADIYFSIYMKDEE